MNTLATAVGFGPLGIQVLEHLYRQSIHDVTFVACLTDPDQLRSSVLPHKFLLQSNGPDEQLTDFVAPLVESTELVFLLADLGDPVSFRAALATANWLQSLNPLCVAVVAMPPTGPSAASDANTVATLGHACHSLLLFQATDSPSDSQVRSMALAIEGLTDLCRNTLGTVDFEDVRYVMRGMGQVAVVRAEASGPQRDAELLSKAINQLAAYALDMSQTDRVLLELSTSPEHPLLMREQIAFTKGLHQQFGTDPRLFKIGYATDHSLADRLQLTLLLWIPMNAHVPNPQ